MAASKRVPSPVALPPTRRPQPGPLPPPAEVKEKLYYHSEAVRIRAGQLGEWFTTPLEGGLWTEWGKHAKPDRIGMTFMAINRVSAAPEPSDESAHRLLHSRYIKTHSGIGPELEEKIAPKYGTSRELDRRDQIWIEHADQLAEEALDRQMRPARQLHWEDMAPLPDDDRTRLRSIRYISDAGAVFMFGPARSLAGADPLRLCRSQKLYRLRAVRLQPDGRTVAQARDGQRRRDGSPDRGA